MGSGGNLEYDESGRRQRSNPGGVRGASPQDGELRRGQPQAGAHVPLVHLGRRLPNGTIATARHIAQDAIKPQCLVEGADALE